MKLHGRVVRTVTLKPFNRMGMDEAVFLAGYQDCSPAARTLLAAETLGLAASTLVHLVELNANPDADSVSEWMKREGFRPMSPCHLVGINMQCDGEQWEQPLVALATSSPEQMLWMHDVKLGEEWLRRIRTSPIKGAALTKFYLFGAVAASATPI